MSDTAHPSHHLKILPRHCAGNDGIGRYFLLPGSASRAADIAKLFDEVQEEIITPRHNDTYLGRVYSADGKPIDVGGTSPGRGPGTTETPAGELSPAGAGRLVRVGTSGSVQFRKVRIGSLVIATGAVRDELASRHWAPLEVPALAHPDTVLAAEKAAHVLGVAGKTFKGVVHTKASLFARAIFMGPRAEQCRQYKDEMIRCGVVASEMEASTRFIVAQCLSETCSTLLEEHGGGPGAIKAGTVLGIIGGEDAWGTDEQIAEVEHSTCCFAIETLRQLYSIDTSA